MMGSSFARAAGCGVAVLLAAELPASAFEPHLLVSTSDGTGGSLATVTLTDPWTPSTGLEPVGERAVLRHWRGIHCVVNPSPTDTVQLIDPDTFDTIRTIPTGTGSDPQDIVVVSETKAYVSLRGRDYLLVVDPSTGAALDSLDLSPFADPDGIPDMARMALGGDRLYVQLQRLDTSGGFEDPVAPSLLAVIDVTTDLLVDADPGTPATDAVALTGVYPVNDMRIDGDFLYVVEQGSTDIIDMDGGIDVIDLTTLEATGFLFSEGQLGGHTNCFVLVSPTKGYAVTHTDLLVSSHLTPFSRVNGTVGGEVFAAVGTYTDQVAYDAATGTLFFPVADPVGVFVVDTAADTLRTPLPVPTGASAYDVLVVRPPAPPTATIPVTLAATDRLEPARPNPFRATTEVRFTLATAADVRITVFDVAGRVRARPVEGVFGAGEHGVVWDGRGGDGRVVSAGVYFVRLDAGEFVATAKVVRRE